MKNTLKEIKNFMWVTEGVVCRNKNIVINSIRIYEYGELCVTFTVYEDECHQKHSLMYKDNLSTTKNVLKNMINIAKKIETDNKSCCKVINALYTLIYINLISERDIYPIISILLDRVENSTKLAEFYKTQKIIFSQK